MVAFPADSPFAMPIILIVGVCVCVWCVKVLWKEGRM